jgi:amidase
MQPPKSGRKSDGADLQLTSAPASSSSPAPSSSPSAPATVLAARVRARTLLPTDLVRAAFQRIRELDVRINAFQLLLEESALEAALALEQRSDLSALPLAGVPIAIKDNLDVAGVPTRAGSLASAAGSATAHHEVVRRAVAAGAIVVGKTRLPELGIWATTDGAWGVTRSPWDDTRTAGGSSGGSAAAVAAGMVPLAIGNDGLGSIRIPAACCGVFGFKPGERLVPGIGSSSDWFGFTENGVFATTVDDGALLLSVLADRAELAEAELFDPPLRIALSTASPGSGLVIDAEHVQATRIAGELLRSAGHVVEVAQPPYSPRFALAVLGHWFAAVARAIPSLDRSRLEARTRMHARWGPFAERLGLVGPRWREEWRARVQPLFDRFDVLLTPTLARPPLAAVSWAQRSWLSNMIANVRFAPLSAPWNLAGYPAATVPFGRHRSGTPIGLQLVSLPGRETALLAVARTLEQLHPWPRHAPRVGSNPSRMDGY